MPSYPVRYFPDPSDLPLANDHAAFARHVADHLEAHFPLAPATFQERCDEFGAGLRTLAPTFAADDPRLQKIYSCESALPACHAQFEALSPSELRIMAVAAYCWGRDRADRDEDADGLEHWLELARESLSDRTIRSISTRSPEQPSLFDLAEETPPGAPPEHLRAALEDLLNGWSLMTGVRPDATDYYRERTATLIADAREALADGTSPYTVLLLVVAPVFRQPDELPLEVIEVPE